MWPDPIWIEDRKVVIFPYPRTKFIIYNASSNEVRHVSEKQVIELDRDDYLAYVYTTKHSGFRIRIFTPNGRKLSINTTAQSLTVILRLLRELPITLRLAIWDIINNHVREILGRA